MKRRSFLQGAAALSTLTILKPATVFGSKANSAIRLGFIGCGKRGTAVISSLSRNTNVNIVAMADLFDYQLETARERVNSLNEAKGFPSVRNSNIYQGSNLILQDVNLEVRRGEFVYLVGKTGTGKSSLLKTLYGDLPLREGEGKVVTQDLKKITWKNVPFLRRDL